NNFISLFEGSTSIIRYLTTLAENMIDEIRDTNMKILDIYNIAIDKLLKVYFNDHKSLTKYDIVDVFGGPNLTIETFINSEHYSYLKYLYRDYNWLYSKEESFRNNFASTTSRRAELYSMQNDGKYSRIPVDVDGFAEEYNSNAYEIDDENVLFNDGDKLNAVNSSIFHE